MFLFLRENLQKEYKTLQDKLVTLPQKIESKTMVSVELDLSDLGDNDK